MVAFSEFCRLSFYVLAATAAICFVVLMASLAAFWLVIIAITRAVPPTRGWSRRAWAWSLNRASHTVSPGPPPAPAPVPVPALPPLDPDRDVPVWRPEPL